MNNAAQRIFGFAAQKWRALPPAERSRLLRIETPDGKPIPLGETPHDRALRGETVVGYRMVIRRRDGATRELLVSTAPVRDPQGRITSAVTSFADITALIVSPETRASAEEINRDRTLKGLNALQLIEVPHVLADDFLPISARRIMAGEIDVEGRMLHPLRVNVGSDNGIKIDAVGNAMARFYDEVVVSGTKVETGVPEQPRGEETRKGAMERARLALGDADLGVGLEAGVFDTLDGLYDVQYCAIIDRRGRYTIGHGSGFRYPPEVAARVKAGDAVGQAFRELYGWEKDGKKLGAIGFLTKGALGRTELVEQAVMAAMVPRVRRDLYPDL
jgi:inosine/xanthosine triphosphatase